VGRGRLRPQNRPATKLEIKSKGEICAQAWPAHFKLMLENPEAFPKPRFPQRRSHALTAKYSKRKGQMAELIFVVKAASVGFAVSKPYGDSEAYDLVVEDKGRLLRIQVKSVFTTNRWGYGVAVARHRLNRDAALYTADEIDFVAAYVVPHDAWYIIPVGAIANMAQIRLYPEGSKTRNGGRFEKYREAWDLLRLIAPASTEVK
jgi:PD-(D/E)XK endonuclease